MTKKVRVENADTAGFKVVVEVWEKGAPMPDGIGGFNTAPDILTRTINLDTPASMADDVYLTSTRYLVVKEA